MWGMPKERGKHGDLNDSPNLRGYSNSLVPTTTGNLNYVALGMGASYNGHK